MNHIINSKFLIFSVSLAVIFIPATTLAQPVFSPMTDLPGVNTGGDFEELMTSLYVMAITIGAMLAVIKIIIAGVKWMVTDIVPNKSDAKKDIKGALIGLLIIISAALILETINPQLTETDLTFNNQVDSSNQNNDQQISNQYSEGTSLGPDPVPGTAAPSDVSTRPDIYDECPDGYEFINISTGCRLVATNASQCVGNEAFIRGAGKTNCALIGQQYYCEYIGLGHDGGDDCVEPDTEAEEVEYEPRETRECLEWGTFECNKFAE